MSLRSLLFVIALLVSLAAGPAQAAFRDDFGGRMTSDPAAHRGWAAFTGDGEATMGFTAEGGLGVIRVDARKDRRGIWWALIKRNVAPFVDLQALTRPDRELRVEARVRTHTAPRRVNLSFNHTRTTDFHGNLAEFDLPDTDWHVISYTTDGFDARPGDEVFVQLAMMDWGLDRFEVDIDYIEVNLVDPKRSGPDLGEPLPYRPPLPAPASYRRQVPVLQDALVDAAYPWVNFRTWTNATRGDARPELSVSGSQTILLRWDLSPYKGRVPDGWGILELTTDSVQWAPTDLEEFGYLRVAEILGGDAGWTRDAVTQESFLAGKTRGEVLGQMFMDIPPSFRNGGKTLIGVSPPVLRRLLSGRSKGIAIYAQGALNATFYSSQAADPDARPKLYFNLK